MTFGESILLGLVQGLGEFLPISSSAHLVIAPWLFRFSDPGLAFDVALHLGTLVAVVAYFWRDWIEIADGSLRHLFRRRKGADGELDRRRFLLLVYLVLATIPGAAAGAALEDLAEGAFRGPLVVALAMVALGVLLYAADRRAEESRNGSLDITLTQALIIGAAQALALVPGVSRSGITITAALFLGLGRVTAARFSFLLSTPIILGACLLKAGHILPAFLDATSVAGILAAAVSGFLAIKYLLRLVERFSYRVFCYYRFVFGAGVAAVYFLRGA